MAGISRTTNALAISKRFECLVGHPTLERLNFGIGGVNDNAAVAAMFPEEMTRPVSYRLRPVLSATTDAVSALRTTNCWGNGYDGYHILPCSPRKLVPK